MTGRVWFITGINSGFGREMARQLLEGGDRVIGTVRDKAAVADLREAYSATLAVQQLDLTDFSLIRPVVDEAAAAFGGLDVVVNNAGYGLFGAAEEFTDEQVLDQIATNLTGSIQVARAAIPHLRARGGGRLIQVSTFGGQGAWPGGSMYHASKWGIEGFTDALVDELAPFGIGVTIAEPGSARTNFRWRSSRVSTPMVVYAGTPADATRQRLADRTSLPIGDPAAMAAAMIATVDEVPAPRRLVLGSDSYAAIHSQLASRLADVESQQRTASRTDLPTSARPSR